MLSTIPRVFKDHMFCPNVYIKYALRECAYFIKISELGYKYLEMRQKIVLRTSPLFELLDLFIKTQISVI